MFQHGLESTDLTEELQFSPAKDSLREHFFHNQSRHAAKRPERMDACEYFEKLFGESI